MLWELIHTGHLLHWWEYIEFACCALVLITGPAAILVIWVTRPPGWPGK